MMKKPMAKMPAMPAARPGRPMPMMANGGQVGKASRMAGNAKSNTCGPGVTGGRDYKK